MMSLLDVVTPQADRIYTALLRKNYFPAQRKSHGEIPPIFTTDGLIDSVTEQIAKLASRKQGFDCINYTSTRFDLVPRILHIPFPKAYINLCNCIKENWQELRHICIGEMSSIKPTEHDDGRIIIMDYEDKEDKEYWHIEQSFSKKFAIHTDITNFFHSIYTHSIGWAAVGHETAKKTQYDKNIWWYNNLDYYQRQCFRNETKGVPIGPATSNIVTEFVLQKIDKYFYDKNLYYIRYIDDYQFYTKTREEAENFIRELRLKLNEFGLHLNTKKTVIYELPDTSENSWMSEIHTAMPKKGKLSFIDAKRYIDYVIVLAKKNPSKSIIKYGLKCILKVAPETIEERNSYSKILSYILNLAYHYPILIPTLSIAFTPNNIDLWEEHKDKFDTILYDSAKNNRSDAVAWILYFSILYKHTINEEVAEKIIETKDCLSILLLYQSNQHENLIKNFYVELMSKYKDIDPNYELDKQWVLLYQLFYDGKIENPYPKNDQSAYETFNILKNNKVSFIKIDEIYNDQLPRIYRQKCVAA